MLYKNLHKSNYNRFSEPSFEFVVSDKGVMKKAHREDHENKIRHSYSIRQKIYEHNKSDSPFSSRMVSMG